MTTSMKKQQEQQQLYGEYINPTVNLFHFDIKNLS